MRTFIGIDLGSTTTKSVLIDENMSSRRLAVRLQMNPGLMQ